MDTDNSIEGLEKAGGGQVADDLPLTMHILSQRHVRGMGPRLFRADATQSSVEKEITITF